MEDRPPASSSSRTARIVLARRQRRPKRILEVGHPIEFLSTQMFPITLHGHLYYTQNEVTVQWFSRDNVPSTAFHGAYSYPDTTVLTMHATPCGP